MKNSFRIALPALASMLIAICSCQKESSNTNGSTVSANKPHSIAIYLTDDEAITYVLKAGPTFDVIARNPLHDECYSSPAVSYGQLFIRTNHYLYCIK